MTIGSQLKKARQKKNLSLEEVHKHTKIHPNVLYALEEERFNQIFNATYVRIFLKEYASYLGLDVNKILEEYNTASPRERFQPQPATVSSAGKPSLPSIDIAGALRFIRTAGIFLLSILIAVFLIRSTTLVIKKASQKTTLALKRSEKAKPVTVKKAAAAIPKLVQQKRESPKQEAATKQPRRLEKTIVAAGEKLYLMISTTEDVWFELKVDGKVIFKDMLKKGSSEKWTASENFMIWTGKAEAMQLNLNGTDLGSLGDGVKKDIVITREGIKK